VEGARRRAGPVYFLTDDDVIVTRPQAFDPFPGLASTVNGIHASYPEPESLWESKDAPPRYSAEYEASDQGRRLLADLSLPAVPFGEQVQRLMLAYIAEERRFRRHTLATQSAAIADIEGNASATYTMRLTAGGASAGLELVAADDPVSGPVSALRLRADHVIVSGQTTLEDTFISTLVARQALVADLRVTTLMIGAEAVTVTRRAFAGGEIGIASPDTWVTVATLALTRAGMATDLAASLSLGGAGSGVLELAFFRGETQIGTARQATGLDGRQVQVSYAAVDPDTGSGLTTYTLRASKAAPATTGGWDADMILTNRYLAVQQFKR